MRVDNVNMFSTSIWKSVLPNFSTVKSNIVKSLEQERSENSNGLKRSNYNGYHSRDIINIKELHPMFTYVLNVVVKKAVHDCALKVNSTKITACWSLFNDKLNAFNFPHCHTGLFSGIFYVNAPKGSGELVFQNNGHNELWIGNSYRNNNLRSELNRHTVSIIPEDGMILLWCSYLPHFVAPNHKNVKRISVSFNVDCD